MSKTPQAPRDTILVSGGFDPAHIGHIRLILEAATHGDGIVVANSDDWLMRKKGYIFVKINFLALFIPKPIPLKSCLSFF